MSRATRQDQTRKVHRLTSCLVPSSLPSGILQHSLPLRWKGGSIINFEFIKTAYFLINITFTAFAPFGDRKFGFSSCEQNKIRRLQSNKSFTKVKKHLFYGASSHFHHKKLSSAVNNLSIFSFLTPKRRTHGKGTHSVSFFFFVTLFPQITAWFFFYFVLPDG